jgi:hypothetical protein
MEQARRMLNMRIKVDVYTQGLDENFREGVRENVRELFCQLHPQRVWLYLKNVRNMLLRDRTIGPKDKIATELEETIIMEGPEDSIAMGSILFPLHLTQVRRRLFTNSNTNSKPHLQKYDMALPPHVAQHP